MEKLLHISGMIDRFNQRVGSAISWLVLLMTLLGVYNAVTRKLSQTIGIDLSSNSYIEGQWYMFSLIFLWGGAYALKNGVHVRVDIVYSKLGQRGKAWVDVLGTILFLIPLCLLILWISVPYAMDSWHVMEGSPDPNGLPRYLIKSAIPIAFVLLLAQAFSELVKNIAVLRGIRGDGDGDGVREAAL